MPTLGVGAVVRVAGQDVLVTGHSTPDVSGFNVNTGAPLAGTEGQLTSVLADTYREYIVGKSNEVQLGRWFVGKVAQNDNGNVGFITSYTPTPSPVWAGVDLETGAGWQSTTLPALLAKTIGIFTTEMLLKAVSHKHAIKPTRDHDAVRPNIPQS